MKKKKGRKNEYFGKNFNAGIGRIEDAIINYNHFWIDEHSPIESYDSNSGMLVMKYNSRFSVSVDYDKNKNAAPPYYLTNVPEAFGEPEHWYLDRTTRTVYYIPKDESLSPEQIEAFVSLADRLFILSGEDLRLSRLELTCTKGDYSSLKTFSNRKTDAILYASDIQSVCDAPGAITVAKARRCEIRDCEIHGVGIHGIEILGGSDHIRIENNHFFDICAGGIRIAGGEQIDRAEAAVTDIVLRNNHIHACGKRYLAGCGILVMHASNCEISENEIHYLAYSGISVGWVWGYKDSATYGCTIRKNHIYDIGKGDLSDMGGIYLLGKQRAQSSQRTASTTFIATHTEHGESIWMRVQVTLPLKIMLYIEQVESASICITARIIRFGTIYSSAETAPASEPVGKNSTMRSFLNKIFLSPTAPPSTVS